MIELMEAEVEAAKKTLFWLNGSGSRSYSMSFLVEAEATEEKFWNLEVEVEAIRKIFFPFLKRKRKLWKILQSNGSWRGSFEIFFHKWKRNRKRYQNFLLLKRCWNVWFWQSWHGPNIFKTSSEIVLSLSLILQKNLYSRYFW